MKNSKAFSFIARSIAAMTALTGLTAQAADGINVQNFSPSLGLNYLYTESAIPDFSLDGKTQQYTRYFLNANYSMVNDPLVQLDSTQTYRVATIVEKMQTLDLMAGMEINGKVAFGIGLPLNLVQRPSVGAAFSPGDMRLMSKIFFSREPGKVAFALVPELRLPTGSSDLYVSDSSFGAGLTLAAETNFGAVKAAANLGYRYANNANFQNMDFRHRLPVGLAVTIPIGPRWYINGEATAAIPLPINRYQNPSELYVGARYFMHRNLAVNMGLAVGDLSGTGSGDLRILAGIKFSPVSDRREPVTPMPTRMSRLEPPKPVMPARVQWLKKEIKISEEVKFETGRDVLTASGKSLLDEVANVIRGNKTSFRAIRIEGHTDEVGSDKINLKLSTQRAAAVREYLASRGIDRKRLQIVGFGKRHPKVDLRDLSKKSRLAANRRVEFKVIN